MKWRPREPFLYDPRLWHTVFALVPHRCLCGTWVWLERVQRRFWGFDRGVKVWQYKFKE